MKTYFAVVSKECDSAYGLWFPDVEGCFAAAEREEDIMREDRNILRKLAK